MSALPQLRLEENERMLVFNYASGMQKFEPLNTIPSLHFEPIPTHPLFNIVYPTNSYTNATNYNSRYQFKPSALDSSNGNPVADDLTAGRSANLSRPLELPQLNQRFLNRLPNTVNTPTPLLR